MQLSVIHSMRNHLECQVMCQVCKTGNHPLVALRRRLDDAAFERLLELREGAKAVRAATQALEVALLRAAVNVD